MIQFHTSIKLKSANEEDEKVLQSEMKKESFIQVAVNEAGNKIPSGVKAFRRKGTDLREILNATFRAVRKVSNTYSFTIISESQN